MSTAIALPPGTLGGQPRFLSAYLDDLGDYIDRTITRATEQGPFGVIGGLLSGRINSFSKFKDALKTSVSAVWQTIKEATAWATVGLSIANERLGKLAWAILPDGFKDPLPAVVKDHMDSPIGKLIDEIFDHLEEPPNNDPARDQQRKADLRQALSDWRRGDRTPDDRGRFTPAKMAPIPDAVRIMGPR
ncbi:MAG: hypothetical protein AAF556_07900 [Pseudomonadota bacterium]